MQFADKGTTAFWLVVLGFMTFILGVRVWNLNDQVHAYQGSQKRLQEDLGALKKQNEMLPAYAAAREIAQAGQWTIVRIDPTSAYNSRSPRNDKQTVPWMLVRQGQDTLYVPISDELMWDARRGKLDSPLQPGNKLLFRAVWPVSSERTLGQTPDVYDFMRLNGWSRS